MEGDEILMRTFVCTTGTSIATNAKVNIERLKTNEIKAPEELELERDAIKEAIFKKIESRFAIGDLENISAEMKSLIKMGINKTDKIVLLASDTEDGFLCAELVKEILKDKYECEVELLRIEGLQANNGTIFRLKGLKNLFNELFRLFENHQYEEIIINPTGGYKSVVPYVTIVGMLFNKPVKYIHEESEDVITLSGIPLIQDEDLMFRIEDKLKKIYSEGGISREEWNLGIDYNDLRYESLIEEDRGFVTLSGIGIILYERFRKDYPDDLERDFTPPEEKENGLFSLRIAHHGIDRLKYISKKLLQSPYVRWIPNSCNNNPSKKPIKPLTPIEAKAHLQHEEIGICIVTDTKSDEGFSFLIKTTAKDNSQNERIAELLKKKYFL